MIGDPRLPPFPGEPLDEPPRRERGWPTKFGEAARGVSLGIRGQSSFCVHFFFAVMAVGAGVLLECGPLEWAVVVLAIGLVFTAELMNSALEALFHGLDEETKQRLVGVLDIAAGAVLLASATAVIVGGIVFGRRLLQFAGVPVG